VNDVALAWIRSRDRVTDMVRSADALAREKIAPLCPEWRVRDIVGHLVGISQDVAAGNFPGDLDEWAAAQVVRNHSADLDGLLDEWPTYELERFVTPELAIVLYDQTTHECDIAQALGVPALVDDATLSLLTDFTLGRFATKEHDLNVTLDLDGTIATRGEGSRELHLTTDAFTWFRASSGRRSRRQIDELEWRGDRSAIDVLFTGIFHPATFDVVEVRALTA
jgi:hypothetical protein